MGVSPRLPRYRQGPPRRLALVPEELPDDDLRLLRDADGRSGGARVQGAHEADRRRRPRARHLGHGQHARPQGPRGRHGPVLAEDPRHEAVAPDGLRGDPGEGVPPLAAADEPDPQGGALHHVRLLRLRVQLDGVGPGVLRARCAREGLPLRRRPPGPGDGRAPGGLQRRARHLGLHALLFLQRALPQGGRPARRDREARRRVGKRRHRPRHGSEARQVVRALGPDDGLAARDRAGAEDAGNARSAEGDEVRHVPRQEGQGAAAVPAPRRRPGAGGPGAPRHRPVAGQGRSRRDRPGRGERLPVSSTGTRKPEGGAEA